jgi:tRNA(Ile)-lysidine synthase
MGAPLAAGCALPELSPQVAINRFLHALRRPTRLLVAISGGSDSTGLLVALAEAIRTRHLPHTLVSATIDHGLRSASADEARQVAALCQALDIPHRIMRWTDEKPATGLSEAARLARYRLLSEAAASMNADALVTGHTLDDQVETVAMRLSRSGNGSLGLAGMASATLYAGHLWILRPFLQTRRQAIRQRLTEQKFTWIDDPSNEDPHYERVRIRRSAPDLDPATITEAGHRREALSRAAAEWLAAKSAIRPGPVAILSIADLPRHPTEIRDHALGTLSAILGGRPHRPASTSLARLTAGLQIRSDFRLTLSGTLVVRRRDQLFLTRERRGLLPLSLASHEGGIWDGRYAIVNDRDTEITITAGRAPEIDADLPGPVRAALAATAPQVLAGHTLSPAGQAGVSFHPRLSLHADFMPLFDQPLADAIASLLGAEPSPACPI